MTRTTRNAAKIQAALDAKPLTRAEENALDLKPYRDEEQTYPKVCSGPSCGKRIIKKRTGCVDRYTKADGMKRWHFFGCGEG